MSMHVHPADIPRPTFPRRVGKDAISQAWSAIFDDDSSKFEVEETFASSDRVVRRWRYSWDDGYVRGVDLFR